MLSGSALIELAGESPCVDVAAEFKASLNRDFNAQ